MDQDRKDTHSTGILPTDSYRHASGDFVPLQPNEYVISDVHLCCEMDTSIDSDVVTSRFVFTVPSTPSIPSAPVASDQRSSFAFVNEDECRSAENVDEDDDYAIRRENSTREVIVMGHKRSTALDDVGSQVWRGALYLSDFILDRPELFCDRVVLELGVGVGLTLSVLQYTTCRCVFGTDYSEDILEQCQINVDRNSHLARCFAVENGKRSAGLDVRLRILDWCSKETLPICCTTTLPDSTSPQNNRFMWGSEDLLILQQDCLIIAADVIYSDALTDAFFDTLFRLFGLLKVTQLTVYMALEKRINFTMEEMAACAPSYQYFLRCLGKFSPKSTDSGRPILEAAVVANGTDANIKQYFQYERVPELRPYEARELVLTSNEKAGKAEAGFVVVYLIRKNHEVEENLKKLIAMKGVTAVLVMTSDGVVIRTTMEPGQAVHYAAMYAPLVQESRMAVTELGGNSLKTIRLRTTKHEVVIIPEYVD